MQFMDRHSKLGTHKTVTARFWPWLSGKIPQSLLSLESGAHKFLDLSQALVLVSVPLHELHELREREQPASKYSSRCKNNFFAEL